MNFNYLKNIKLKPKFSILSFIFMVLCPFYISISDFLESKESFAFFKEHHNIIYITAIVVFCISALYQGYVQYKINIFENTYKYINIYRSLISSYFDDELKQISQSLNYTEEERISLYLYSQSNNEFYSVGRYSKSPEYNEVGRYIIKDKEEYLYKVINEDKSKHKGDEFQIGKNFKMKSESIFGVSIENDGYKIGVIVVQSMKKKKFKNSDTRNKIKAEASKIEKKIIEMNINPNSIVSNTNIKNKGF